MVTPVLNEMSLDTLKMKEEQALEQTGAAAARPMHLAAFVYPTGYHTAAWRRDDVPANMGVDFEVYRRIAARAEDAGLDFLFFADSLGIQGTDWPTISRSALRYVSQFEPLSLISALAATTRRIGLVGTASTTYGAPFHVARQFLSADHVSGGRVGWNLVTSQNPDEAPNFGSQPFPDHTHRYARAKEFVDVVLRLWDTWSGDAFVRDKAAGRFFEPSAMQLTEYHGDHFDVRGPMNLPRSPQGRPVIVQAGASEEGRALAARSADLVFTAQQSAESARAFYTDIKRRAADCGRDPTSILIFPGMFVYAATTLADAEAERDCLQALIDPEVAASISATQLGGIDLGACAPEDAIPQVPETNLGQSRRQLLLDHARERGFNVGELITHIAGSRGHYEIVGSAAEVADELSHWHSSGCADGFCIMPPYFPGAFDNFCDLVVPELTRRGLFRSGYESTTLRGHLGLGFPERASGASAE